MFPVLFEVFAKSNQWDNYLGNAKMSPPELEKIDGFVDNIRYKSLTRGQNGRSESLRDYHLRGGQITDDARVPPGYSFVEKRLDEIEVGHSTTVTFIDAKRPAFPETSNPADCAEYHGFNPFAEPMIEWDVFEAVLTPGDLILLISSRDNASAQDFTDKVQLSDDARLRRVRIVPDYGMFDRREAPQYYPKVPRDAVQNT